MNSHNSLTQCGPDEAMALVVLANAAHALAPVVAITNSFLKCLDLPDRLPAVGNGRLSPIARSSRARLCDSLAAQLAP